MSGVISTHHGGQNGHGTDSSLQDGSVEYSFETAPFDPAPFFRAFGELQTAFLCAESSGQNPWLFAVEIDCLRDLGISNTVLRWMILNSFLDHMIEVTSEMQMDRSFERAGGIRFAERSCLMLTGAGNSWLQQFLAELPVDVATPTAPKLSIRPLPSWDDQRKRLVLGEKLVKYYRVYSPNQETVLCAFQEEGWPARIDDPLRPTPNQCAKTRLHDTIKNLNRNQKHRLLKFRGDGTGEGVLWEYREGRESG